MSFPARAIARLSAAVAALLALAIGWWLLPEIVGSGQELFPLPLVPLLIWSFAPLVAPFAVRARERGSLRAPGLIAAVMAVEALSIVSGGGAFYALFVAPVLLLAFMTSSAIAISAKSP